MSRTMGEMLEELHRSESIYCPYCAAKQGVETVQECTSWEGGTRDCVCDTCEETFIVHEIVTREFESYKSEQDEGAQV